MVLFLVSIILVILILMVFVVLLAQFGVIFFSLSWFNLEFLSNLEFVFSIWSFLFLILVLIISLSVAMFSFSYMSGMNVSNFMILFSWFIFSMLWLILSNNFYWMMFGWDGLGVVSFLLIVYYMNSESINNGLFTIFQNRVGDLFFVLFILLVFDLAMVTTLVLKVGLLFLILGASVKSAQFPFNSWLLSAMSAPTPISSLVHSSTLVVAGVYILLQFSYCLFDVLQVLKFISLLTLILSFFGLLNENDMKKLIAYSTMSHVALMLYLLSFKLFKVVFFHLNIHAMFKSLMFMCFGFVMLTSFHSQDKRLVMLINLNPIIKVIYYYSCLCMAGLPFLTAFFSKDFIIENFLSYNFEMVFMIFLLLFLSLSIYYSMKLLSLTCYIYSFFVLEKAYLGMFSVFFMVIVSSLLINVYISLLFTLNLEVVSLKFSIYGFMLIFLILSVLTNLNYKMIAYEKMKNFKEIWFLNFYMLDKFVYFSFNSLFVYMSLINSMKFLILVNWWVLILFVLLF